MAAVILNPLLAEKGNAMKILVIDDKAINLKAAEQTIVGHDLTLAKTWDEAVELLKVRYDKEAIKNKLVAAGLPATSDELCKKWTQPWTDANKQAWDNWWKRHEEYQSASQIPYW